MTEGTIDALRVTIKEKLGCDVAKVRMGLPVVTFINEAVTYGQEGDCDDIMTRESRGTSMSKPVKSEASRGAGCSQTSIRHSA